MSEVDPEKGSFRGSVTLTADEVARYRAGDREILARKIDNLVVMMAMELSSGPPKAP